MSDFAKLSMRRKLCRVQFEINTECKNLNAVLTHELEMKLQRHLYLGCHMKGCTLKVSCLPFHSIEM